ncbi:hypothetical protein [Streptomyces sp. NPDC001970]
MRIARKGAVILGAVLLAMTTATQAQAATYPYYKDSVDNGPCGAGRHIGIPQGPSGHEYMKYYAVYDFDPDWAISACRVWIDQWKLSESTWVSKEGRSIYGTTSGQYAQSNWVYDGPGYKDRVCITRDVQGPGGVSTKCTSWY